MQRISFIPYRSGSAGFQIVPSGLAGTNELLQKLSSAISDIELQMIGIKAAAGDAKRGAEASTDFGVTKVAVDRA